MRINKRECNILFYIYLYSNINYLVRVRRTSSFMMISGWRVLILLRLTGILGRLVTWKLAALWIGGLLRAMEGLCIRVLLTRRRLRRLSRLGRLLLTSVRTNTLIRLDFPLQSLQQFSSFTAIIFFGVYDHKQYILYLLIHIYV